MGIFTHILKTMKSKLRKDKWSEWFGFMSPLLVTQWRTSFLDPIMLTLVPVSCFSRIFILFGFLKVHTWRSDWGANPKPFSQAASPPGAMTLTSVMVWISSVSHRLISWVLDPQWVAQFWEEKPSPQLKEMGQAGENGSLGRVVEGYSWFLVPSRIIASYLPWGE
jgi:hypothetical protein